MQPLVLPFRGRKTNSLSSQTNGLAILRRPHDDGSHSAMQLAQVQSAAYRSSRGHDLQVHTSNSPFQRSIADSYSHIFCERCSDRLGLTNTNASIRTCPACETQLNNPDDAVLTNLNPAEDYKTSVLSGLNPSVIMECASRGVAFFQYQMAQEM